jgi:hypothetical protein
MHMTMIGVAATADHGHSRQALAPRLLIDVLLLKKSVSRSEASCAADGRPLFRKPTFGFGSRLYENVIVKKLADALH